MSTEPDKARADLTSEERLVIALGGIPDDMAPDIDAKRNVWNVCSYALVKMLDGLGDLAPNRFAYVFSYDDSESYEIEVHRVRGESQLDALAKSNAALERALEAVDRLTAALAESEAIPLRMIRAAKGGASDYLGGYHDDRLEVFRHGMGTIVSVIEAAAKVDPTDYQTRANVRMGAALDAAKEKV